MLSYNLFKARVQIIENKIRNKENESDIFFAWNSFKKSGERDIYKAMQLVRGMLIHNIEKDKIEDLNYMFFEFILDIDTLFQDKTVIYSRKNEVEKSRVETLLKKIKTISFSSEKKWLEDMLKYIKKLSDITEQIDEQSLKKIDKLYFSFEKVCQMEKENKK